MYSPLLSACPILLDHIEPSEMLEWAGWVLPYVEFVDLQQRPNVGT